MDFNYPDILTLFREYLDPKRSEVLPQLSVGGCRVTRSCARVWA